MRRSLSIWFAVLALGASSGLVTKAALAKTEPDDFVVKTADDLFDVCSTEPSDPLYTAAANFCQGFVVGAYHVYEALEAKPGHHPLVCPPDPKPTRNETIAAFVAWGKGHPEYLNERPVEVLFKFLIERWPCPKK
jgi:Ssp1 endopeptidase immunity protein Rap1a